MCFFGKSIATANKALYRKHLEETMRSLRNNLALAASRRAHARWPRPVLTRGVQPVAAWSGSPRCARPSSRLMRSSCAPTRSPHSPPRLAHLAPHALAHPRPFNLFRLAAPRVGGLGSQACRAPPSPLGRSPPTVCCAAESVTCIDLPHASLSSPANTPPPCYLRPPAWTLGPPRFLPSWTPHALTRPPLPALIAAACAAPPFPPPLLCFPLFLTLHTHTPRPDGGPLTHLIPRFPPSAGTSPHALRASRPRVEAVILPPGWGRRRRHALPPPSATGRRRRRGMGGERGVVDVGGEEGAECGGSVGLCFV